ncbi:hypothetical protein QJS04_geneDACA021453 [Acorus gramineus]|uniref:Uncharacterized protein n=1 Tax=Acorus gramineus TaxID=55184 RepID=A0AAV9BB87_ACOGR|nr:hypothetical protein QJS04_geneDACA021453 [Acorus gramineus]
MENPNPSEGGQDGLEIVSIGALYSGPWDKKYWSSTRGKDRFPYPVGYRAVRCHAGSTYSMEIHEGLKGPVFVVTSPDGDSCSGQTPDIAWDAIQKKCCSRVKNWHGKRFSSKINGGELFGFGNPLVQRLLRELVANVNGTAERSSRLSTFCNGTDKKEQETSTAFPKLLPYMCNQHSTGKRSRKCRNSNATIACGKRFRSCDLVNDAQGETSLQRDETCSRGDGHDIETAQKENCSLECEITLNEDPLSKNNLQIQCPGMSGTTVPECESDGMQMTIASSCQNTVVAEDQGTFYLEIKLPDTFEGGNEINTIDNDKLLEHPTHSGHHVESHVFPDGSKVSDHQNLRATADDKVSNANEKPIDRSLNSGCKENASLLETKNNDSGIPLPMKDMNLCVPDSLDFHDNSEIYAAESNQRNPCTLKDEFISSDTFSVTFSSNDIRVVPKHEPMGMNAEGLGCTSKCMNDPSSMPNEKSSRKAVGVVSSMRPVKELPPEEEQGTFLSSQNASSEKTDSDSPGQDLARSMMTVLLPQALPLLKKTYKRKKANSRNKEIHFSRCEPQLNSTKLKSSIENDDVDHPSVATSHQVDSIPVAEKSVPIHNGNLMTVPHLQAENIGDGVCDHAAHMPLVEGVNFESFNAVIPDSFEEYQKLHDNAIGQPLHHQSCETHEATTRDIENDHSAVLVIGSVDATTKSSVGKDENNDIFSREAPKASVGVIESNEILVSGSPLGNMSPSKDFHLEEEVSDICKRGHEEFSHTGVLHPNQNSLSSACIKQLPDLGMSLVAHENSLQLSGEDAHKHEENTPSLDHNVPLSEIIICRNFRESDATETCCANETQHMSENVQVDPADSSMNLKSSSNDHVKVLKDNSDASIFFDHCISDIEWNHLDGQANHIAPHNHTEHHKDTLQYIEQDYSDPKFQACPGMHQLMKSTANDDCKDDLSHDEVCKRDLVADGSFTKEVKSNKDMNSYLELVGCYMHPKPILSILLSTKEDDLRMCVLSGSLDDDDKTLFIYKIPYKNLRRGCPVFYGYTSIVLPSKGAGGVNAPCERSVLQFTPDGQHLVMLDHFRVPCCREQNIGCLCSVCKSTCHEENAIKVIDVQNGYVTLITKMISVESVFCILVCEPSHLVAVGQSGRLHVWNMNKQWSAPLEEFNLPSFSYAPARVELKKIPQSESTVLGHDGIGGFGLWCVGIFTSYFCLIHPSFAIKC